MQGKPAATIPTTRTKTHQGIKGCSVSGPNDRIYNMITSNTKEQLCPRCVIRVKCH